jgi:hypothetical protein
MASLFRAEVLLYRGGVLVATLECPFCFEILDIQPPDRFHSAFSLEKPIPKSYHAKIIKNKYTCANPKCRQTLTIYWYAPLEYFNRI